MANVKISALPAATSVASADVLPIVQSATTKKATFQNVIDAVVSNEPGTSFRNRIINGDFSINQRGFTSSVLGSTGVGTYGFDRWTGYGVDGTTTMSSQSFTAGNPITGQEPANFLRLVTTGQTLATAQSLVLQRIEGVRTFAGQQVTLSFWAKATSGTPKIAIEYGQEFGTGGSAQVQTYAGQITLSTSWTRYSVTTNIPSISGKTIGTNDCLIVAFYVSAGSNLNARTGSLGIQTNTFDIWGVQVEAGSTASAFERRPIGAELQMCMRYYWRIATGLGTAVCNSIQYDASLIYSTIHLPTPMRAVPSMDVIAGTGNYSKFANGVQTNFNTIGINASPTSSTTTTELSASVAGTAGHAGFVRTGSSSSYVAYNAEL